SARVLPRGQRPQRAERELEQPQRRLPFDRRQALRGLRDGAGRGVARVVVEELLAVERDRLHLTDRVQRAAHTVRRAGELEVDVPERLEPRAEPGGGAADPTGDGPDPAV